MPAEARARASVVSCAIGIGNMVFGPRRAVNRSAEEERRTGFNKRFIDEFYDSRMPWGIGERGESTRDPGTK